jgi:diguanylate cyclase (GGDEF)-like protein
MLDIDFFKKVNDTYGHGTGDEVLRGVADVLVSTIRSSDIVGRYGGEEFCFVFPEIGIETARQLVERIRKAVAVLQFSGGEKPFSITASIGAAGLAGSGESLDGLLSRCDHAPVSRQGRRPQPRRGGCASVIAHSPMSVGCR